jgi:hypothetical protein
MGSPSSARRHDEHGADYTALKERGIKDRVQDADRLVDALHRVAAGEVVIDPEVVQRILLRPRVIDPLERLKPVERQVLRCDRTQAELQRQDHRETRHRDLPEARPAPSHDHDRGDVNVRVLAVLTYLRTVDQIHR